MPRTCVHCGEPLQAAASAYRQYCSDACRQAAYRLRKADTPTVTTTASSGGTMLLVLALGAGLLLLGRR